MAVHLVFVQYGRVNRMLFERKKGNKGKSPRFSCCNMGSCSLLVYKERKKCLSYSRYSSPTCTVFLLGSSGWGLRSCLLANSYASGGEVFIVGLAELALSYTSYVMHGQCKGQKICG